MGWTFDPRGLRPGESAGERMASEMDWSTSDAKTGDKHTIIAWAMVGSTWYAALEIKRATGKREVVALIALTSKRRGEFGYKDMDESMGPIECDCPQRIMDLLTPLADDDTSYAREWRAQVAKQRVAKARLRATIRSLKPGMRVKLAEPVSYFKGGLVADEFTFLAPRPGQRSMAFSHPGYPGVRFGLRMALVASATVLPAAD